MAETMPPRSGRPLTTSYADLMKPDEDWRHLPNSAERRRIQNRLAQRAYRRNMRDRSKEVEKLKKQLQELQESSNNSNHSSRDQSLVSGSRSDSSEDTMLPHHGDAASLMTGSPPHVYNCMQPWSLQDNLDKLEDFCNFIADDGPPTSMPFNVTPPYFSPLPTMDDDIMPELSASTTLGGRPRAVTTTIAPSSTQQHPQPPRSHSISAGFPSHNSNPLPWNVQAAERRGTLPGLTSFNMFANNGDRALYYPDSVFSLADTVPGLTPYATSPDSDLNSVDSWSAIDKTVKSGSASFLTNPDGSKALPETTAPLLHFAVAGGSIDTLQFLLRQPNANLDARDREGYTALQRAVMSGRPDMAAILLESGAAIEDEGWRVGGVGGGKEEA